MPSSIAFEPPKQQGQTKYYAKVQGMALSPLKEELVFESCMPDNDEGDIVLKLQWSDSPGEKAHWVLAIVADKSDVKPKNAGNAQRSSNNLWVPVLRTIDLIADDVERDVWLFPEVGKLMVLVHPPDEYVLEIYLADQTRAEIKATGVFFRNITNVFKNLSVEELYYVNVIRGRVFPPRGANNLPSTTAHSWTRDRTQIQHCVDRMQATGIQAIRAVPDAGMSFSGYLATDHFKAALDELRGISVNDQAAESDLGANNLPRSGTQGETQASSTESEAKAQREFAGNKFAEEAVDQLASVKEKPDL